MLDNYIKIFQIVFFLALALSAQSQKEDYVWIFGHNSSSSPGIEGYVFDFNKGSSPDSIRDISPISIRGSNASICDKDGNLLLYTNGCHIVGSDHKILPNGTGINDGTWLELQGDTCRDYPLSQDIVILPNNYDRDLYYILHKTLEYDGAPFISNIKYTSVDLSLNNDIGDVVEKNISILDSTRIQWRYLTALIHNNKKDWWVLNPDKNENSIITILLNEDGFNEMPSQKIDHAFHLNASAAGEARFSPNGNKYAYYNLYDELLLFDFDRTLGLLSNLKKIDVIEQEPGNADQSTIEWSSNSRFIYIAKRDELWQLDTWEEDIEASKTLIDVWNGVLDPFATSFYIMALAPDCKIYMCSGSSTNSYHVINKPNEKGIACDFVQQAVKLPFISSRGNMPNFPRFRVDEEDKCDPGITSVFGEQVYYRRDLSVYPNPVKDQLTVDLPDNYSGQIYIYNLEGQIVKNITKVTGQIDMDLDNLPAGTYVVEFVPENNIERLFWNSQVVKVD